MCDVNVFLLKLYLFCLLLHIIIYVALNKTCLCYPVTFPHFISFGLQKMKPIPSTWQST